MPRPEYVSESLIRDTRSTPAPDRLQSSDAWRRKEAMVAMRAESVQYRDGETPLTGYLVSDDDQSGRRPGVLVVHGGAGLDEHARGRARRIAALGYVAFACDM